MFAQTRSARKTKLYRCKCFLKHKKLQTSRMKLNYAYVQQTDSTHRDKLASAQHDPAKKPKSV